MLHTLSAYAGEGNIDRFYQNSVFEIKNLTQKQWWAGTNQVDLEWEATQTADSYQIVLRSLNGKQTRKLTSKCNYITVKNLKNQVYKVKVRGIKNINGSKKYTPWKETCCLGQAVIRKCRLKSGALQVEWKKVSGATGYHIYLSKEKKKDYSKVMELDGDQTQATIKRWNGKKIKNGTYYLYVESIYEDGDKQAVSGAVNCWDTTGKIRKLPKQKQNDYSVKIPIDESVFPDEHFRKWVNQTADENKDGFLSQTEADIVDSIVIKCNKEHEFSYKYYNQQYKNVFDEETDITEYCGETIDLTGASLFRNVSKLYFMNINPVNFDVKEFKYLMELDFRYVPIESLDMSEATHLYKIILKNLPMTQLNIATNTALNELRLENLPLTQLDLSGDRMLQYVTLKNLPLKTLDFSNNRYLYKVSLENVPLTQIDMYQARTWQYEMRVLSDRLQTILLPRTMEVLDISGSKGMKEISSATIISKWDTKPARLGSLYAADASLESADLTCLPDILELDLRGNPLNEIDLSVNNKISALKLIGSDSQNAILAGNLKRIIVNPVLMDNEIFRAEVEGIQKLSGCQVIYAPAQATDLKIVKTTKTSATIQFKAAKKAQVYEIYDVKSKKLVKTVADNGKKKIQCKISGLKAGTKQYYVRAYTVIDGQKLYGKDSQECTVKIKK